MNVISKNLASERYARCVQTSKRVRWEIEEDVIRGRRFDAAHKFLPDGLSLADAFTTLSPDHGCLLWVAAPWLRSPRYRSSTDSPLEGDGFEPSVPRHGELMKRAKKLRWICAARAGLGGAWFYDALVKSDVVVTNMRGSYNEHLAGHAVAFLLAFARRFDHYLPQRHWQRGPEMIDLPKKTVLIVGVGGAGSEASKLCAALGMRVLGIDPRVTEPPVGMADLATPDRLEERLGEADFVILTTPETPDTVGMFNTRLFARMKRGV